MHNFDALQSARLDLGGVEPGDPTGELGPIQVANPDHFAGREFPRRTVLNLDADLYTSTLMVLTQLMPKLKERDVMIFDDFRSYLHEYRAFCDAMGAYRRGFEALCRTEDWARIALRVTY